MSELRVRRIGESEARVIPRELVTARATAASIVAAAETEAARIREEATRERDALIARGRAEGREAGDIERQRAILEATSRRDAILAGSSDELLAVALELAERVVMAELASEPARFETLARSALDRARRATRGTLRIHPDDAGAWTEALPTWLELVLDAQLARGSCLLSTDVGAVDAGVRAQLVRFREALARVEDR